MDFTIHLTYRIGEIDVEREKDWIKEQQKETGRKKKHLDVKVREDWAPAKHGLTGFFAEHPELAKKVSVVEKDKPHVIDLLDPVTF